MLVHQILKSKSDDAVVTVSPGTKVSEAVKILAERKIGTVVVSGDGHTADGILSERDVVRVLAQRGGAILQDPVEQYMTAKLVTCTREDKADAVLQMMTDGRFRHMPVLEGNQLVGLITLGDVVKARLTELAMEKNALEGMIMGH
ncbi:CBS domain-containing protein [uncultured Tateyamaria sp.]|uniref:CBS domain-containing protein n=1 Tax=uncultured Tateyamaria sp. TaxID=455651 RepID=UPI002614EE85|nr:CBS domain-containing protein [uncultured Tateyamaria sp.]